MFNCASDFFEASSFFPLVELGCNANRFAGCYEEKLIAVLLLSASLAHVAVLSVLMNIQMNCSSNSISCLAFI